MDSDVVVIGAGPAGAAISAILSQNNFSVTVLEKSTFPRFSIGESLLPQCMVYLKEAGLLDCIPPDLFQVKKGALFTRGSQTSKIDFSDKFTSGPSETWQVMRSDFDEILINKSAEFGTRLIFDAEVKSVSFSENSASLSYSKDGQEKEISTKFVVDASGGAMVLPRLMNAVSQPKISKLALFAHFQGDQRSTEESENILISINPKNSKIWYWGIPLKDDLISVGVVTDLETLNNYDGNDSEKFQKVIAEEPNLSRRLKNANPIRAVKKIVGYEAAVKSVHGDRFLLIGNAGGFIDPIFSSGITVALKSAVIGAKNILKTLSGKNSDWTSYDQEMSVGNNTFKAYVDSWYDGTLQDIILMHGKEPEIQKKINSILAGYVWDPENSFVREPKRKLNQVSSLVERFPAK